MTKFEKNMEKERITGREKENLSDIKKQLATLLSAIGIGVSSVVGTLQKVEDFILPTACAGEIKKEYKEVKKNIKTVEVNNMQEFENYVVNKLDNTQNVAIIKIKKNKFDDEYYKENIDNNFWNIKILDKWEDGDYEYFLIAGTKFKESNEGFRKVIVALDEESNRLDEKTKGLDVQIAYHRFETEMTRVVVFLNYGENVDILKKYNWKFSRKKLEQINEDLDKISVLKVDETMFKQWIDTLEKLKRKYTNMKDLIEQIIKKLKSKKRISPSMYTYLRK